MAKVTRKTIRDAIRLILKTRKRPRVVVKGLVRAASPNIDLISMICQEWALQTGEGGDSLFLNSIGVPIARGEYAGARS